MVRYKFYKREKFLDGTRGEIEIIEESIIEREIKGYLVPVIQGVCPNYENFSEAYDLMNMCLFDEQFRNQFNPPSDCGFTWFMMKHEYYVEKLESQNQEDQVQD